MSRGEGLLAVDCDTTGHNRHWHCVIIRQADLIFAVCRAVACQIDVESPLLRFGANPARTEKEPALIVGETEAIMLLPSLRWGVGVPEIKDCASTRVHQHRSEEENRGCTGVHWAIATENRLERKAPESSGCLWGRLCLSCQYSAAFNEISI